MRAARLDLSHKRLGGIIGVSEATGSSMGSGQYALAPGDPFGTVRDRRLWTHPTDYETCQTLADRARAAARPCHGRRGGSSLRTAVSARFATDRRRLEFDRAAFAHDPRMASFEWDRVGRG